MTSPLHFTLWRAVGALAAALTVAVASPAVASAQTASWNDPTYGAIIHAHPDWLPYLTSAANDVSTETSDRDSLALAGDAERVALVSAAGVYADTVAPVDPANTYAIGDTETTLTSSSPTSRTWDTWVTIYTIAHPTQGYRYCEFHYTVNATLSADDDTWTPSATFRTRGCAALNYHEPAEPTPMPLQATVWQKSGNLATMNRGNAEHNVILASLQAWEDAGHLASDTSYGVNFSMKLDADSWYVIFTVYNTDEQIYCVDGWTVDFDVVEPIEAATVTPSGGQYCTAPTSY
jgi:hypothetical protein